MPSNIDTAIPAFGNATTAGVRENFSNAKIEIEALQSDIAKYTSPYFVVVDSLADLPSPVADVIQLEANKAYLFTTTVDLLGDRLICGQNTTLLGTSSENCRIKSTGLASALITSEWSLPIRNITLEADVVFNLNAAGNAAQAIDWFGVNLTGCTTIGTIANYSNFVMSESAFLESDGLTFDGSFDTIAFNQVLFNAAAGGVILNLPSTLTVTRRFRIIYSSFVVLSGETGISVDNSASIPAEGYILDSVNFSGGGTYTSGVGYSDNKVLWVNCRNVTNSTSSSYMTMQSNATATTISGTSSPVKVSGTTTLNAISQKFTHSNNRLTYAGALSRSFKIQVVSSLTAGNSQTIGLHIAKNGIVQTVSANFTTTSGAGKAENSVSQAILELVTGDYVEVFTSNETAVTNITVSNLSVTVENLN